jgi:hypothetical protein
VQDLAENPDISLDFDRLKKTSSDQLAPFSHSSFREQVVRVGQDIRSIEQNAPKAAILGDDGSQ